MTTTHAPAEQFGIPQTYASTRVFFIHSVNAFERDDTIALEAPRYPQFMTVGKPDILAQGVRSQLCRWTFDLMSGQVSEEMLDDRLVEFPRINERLTGRCHAISYTIGGDLTEGPVAFGSIVKHDSRAGVSTAYSPGEGRVPSEAIFVPARNASGEDDGWLLSFVYEPRRDASDLEIADECAPDQKTTAGREFAGTDP
jgi:carotenoid cleavage dioxygenase-like enzyme